MKQLFTILLLLPLLSQAQPSCKKFKGLFEDHHTFRSAFDNLRSDTVNVLNYDIYLDFTQMGAQQISGSCEVKFQALMPITTLSLDLLQLNIDSIVQQGSQVNYSYNDTLIVVQLSSALNTNDIDSVTVYYSGSPQQDASGWGGFYFQSGYAYNLGVGFAADPHNYGRVWHPCFDNFAERATYDYAILTNNQKTAYCNGARQSITPVGTDSLVTVWRMDDAIPSYLASVAVADYTHAEQTYVSPVTNDTTPIWLISQPGDTTNFKSSFTNIQNNIQAYEESYGPHAWNKVGFVLVPFNSGAMEHATNICYPKATANGSLFYETLMAHELSHHWWGDLVTCQTEEEMWINEGMASYSEKLFLEHVYGWDAYLNEMRNNHHSVVHLAHVIDSGYYAMNAVPHAYTYGEHSYNKGSDVAHTLRGYLGDSLFFAGLTSVISNFAGGNLSSTEFMDHLNTIPGIDATDFFNDWIFTPGFSHYSVNNFQVSGSGPYTVDIVVDQKLKGRSSYHNNAPLQVTFMDANWNVHTEEISMSGPFMSFNFQVPIDPLFVGINMDERINDATTAVTKTITSTGLKDYPYAEARLNVNSITDSAFVRIEHNWVAPDDANVPSGVAISTQRYWKMHGIDTDNMDASMRLEYNGQLNNAGHYDDELLVNLGGQPFIEDSIVLLYRPDAQSAWSEHPSYTLNFTGLNTDKKGFADIDYYMSGQYTWGYKTNSVGIEEINQSQVRIYPNPAYDVFNVDLTAYGEGKYKVEVYDLNGKLLMTKPLTNEKNTIDISSLSASTYVITVLTDDKMIGNKRLVISK